MSLEHPFYSPPRNQKGGTRQSVKLRLAYEKERVARAQLAVNIHRMRYNRDKLTQGDTSFSHGSNSVRPWAQCNGIAQQASSKRFWHKLTKWYQRLKATG